jgi:hypothetical protein
MNNEEETITLIESDLKANFILGQILEDKGCIIGVDCEAALEMSRFGILCLIQVNSLLKTDLSWKRGLHTRYDKNKSKA